MKIDTSKYLWLILVGLIIVGAGIFYWTASTAPQPASLNNSSPMASPSPKTANASDAESPVSPVSPISPISPVESNQELPKVASEKIQPLIDQTTQAFEQKDYDRVIKLAEEILTDDPANFITLNLRGSAYFEQGNLEQALNDYTKAAELEPLYPYSFYNRGRLLRIQGKYTEALADLQKAAELSPLELGYRANGNIGLIYYQQGDYDKAIKTFNTSISFNKNNKADVYFFRGEAYAAKEDYQAAIQDYQAAIERFKNYSAAYQSLGFAYYKTNQLPQAEQSLTKALEIAPNAPEAQLYLSLVQLAKGQPDAAQTSVQKAVAKIETLSPEQRQLVEKRVTGALRALAKDKPTQAATVDQLLKLLPGN